MQSEGIKDKTANKARQDAKWAHWLGAGRKVCSGRAPEIGKQALAASFRIAEVGWDAEKDDKPVR